MWGQDMKVQNRHALLLMAIPVPRLLLLIISWRLQVWVSFHFLQSIWESGCHSSEECCYADLAARHLRT